MTSEPQVSFDSLGLSKDILASLKDVGYERPSPIQSLTIPQILAGRDVLGQAQTGTGKTAAFALPILTNLDLRSNATQVLVLTPTRELAIQVSEAFQTYAARMEGFHVQPIYGGQDYSIQLRCLRRGVHVVVGTPGRVMDHIRRGTLKLEELRTLVLDEADEMLRMGFVEDVQWILDCLPKKRQIALFSATMPPSVQQIAEKYLVSPELIQIKSKSSAAETVRQRYWVVRQIHKLDALTRMLEAETFDGAIIFVRTKIATIELAEKLKARGFAAEALNGDIVQKQREKTVSLLKKGVLDILVATDVAARGLDVERITHVINYDIPFDTESYIHRIGRTGRAGRAGDAILFVAPREQRMLRAIERATKNSIEPMELPTKADVVKKRIDEFKRRLLEALDGSDLETYADVVTDFSVEHHVPIEIVAAALAKISQGERPLQLDEASIASIPEAPPVRSRREASSSEASVRKDRHEHRPGGKTRHRKGRTGSSGARSKGHGSANGRAARADHKSKRGAPKKKVEGGKHRARSKNRKKIANN